MNEWMNEWMSEWLVHLRSSNSPKLQMLYQLTVAKMNLMFSVFFAKVSSEMCRVRSAAGRLFHVAGPLTEKPRSSFWCVKQTGLTQICGSQCKRLAECDVRTSQGALAPYGGDTCTPAVLSCIVCDPLQCRTGSHMEVAKNRRNPLVFPDSSN